MSDFTPINTQEEFDAMIKDRLARERAKFADYEDIRTQLADAQGKIADFEKAIESNQKAYDKILAESKEKDTKIAGFEADALRTTVAINKNLPMNMRKYLQGTTEEELNASADELKASGVGHPAVVPPLATDPEPSKNDYSMTGKINTDRAMQKFVKALNESMNEKIGG